MRICATTHFENRNGPLSMLFYDRLRSSAVSVSTHSFPERPWDVPWERRAPCNIYDDVAFGFWTVWTPGAPLPTTNSVADSSSTSGGTNTIKGSVLQILTSAYVGIWHIAHHIYIYIYIHRVSHELRSLLRESVSYVKLYRYNQKHLYPKLNGYRDIGQRKEWTSLVSAYCTRFRDVILPSPSTAFLC